LRAEAGEAQAAAIAVDFDARVDLDEIVALMSFAATSN